MVAAVAAAERGQGSLVVCNSMQRPRLLVPVTPAPNLPGPAVPLPHRRSIFCCLAPSSNEQYVRQDEGPVVIRPIAPQPPSWTEPVLGPQLAQDSGKKTLVLDLGACVAGCAAGCGGPLGRALCACVGAGEPRAACRAA